MPITDNFSDYTAGLTGPICGAFDVVPDDAADLAQVTRGFMVGGAGDVAVTLKSGDAITLVGLVAGVVYPFRVAQVRGTGTTATGIKGLV
ncbi:spike base protein, RCAP_Rcc01079 family [Sulfitobacter sp.]|uniref:spike base protein, RCAP_Rcc01079 family n=1 Tax=Sulfitobacter sp. TaxID=1903071 RepID=UPI00300295B9|tara:strand:+ start:394 stop:663 length:270 start_codon:yes stop_codon:yes gene_type:complete